MKQDLPVVPFRQYVLKVHSRCDLACDHCYVYEHSDQSWRGRPKDGMSAGTAASAARRIAEHAAAHGLPEVHVILHGGEPLLLGVPRTRELVEILRREISPVTGLSLRMHTNGVLLSEEYLDLLAEYDVQVGVSLDGGRSANDLHRLDRRGQSSYDRVVAALELLRRPAYRHLYSGLLCTIDLQNDPVEAYQALLVQEPPRIDFLLPHATWEHQPFGLAGRREPARATQGPAPYADWLGRIFAAWQQAGRPVPIRTFDSVLAALHGRPSGTESLGLIPADLIVIETDGTLEQADWLKTAFEGAAATGFDVFRNTLDEAASHAGIVARQHGLDDLCGTCRACPVVDVCGGGLYAHRYDPGSGFDNPSVYCPDLLQMITRISEVEGVHATVRANGPELQGSGLQEQIPTHALSPGDFDEIAAGHGGPTAMRVLADVQLSIRRSLLAQVARTGPQDNRLFTGAWDRLATLDETNPVLVDQALAHPYVREWAVRCLQSPVSTWKRHDVEYLAAVAVSAHLRGGALLSLTAAVHEGLVHLPGAGALTAFQGDCECTIQVVSERWVVASAGERVYKAALAGPDADPHWQPVRRLEADGLSVAIEDLDPYRDCHQSPALRLGAVDMERWQTMFAAAVRFIDEQLPSHAPALRAGLTTVTPLLALPDAGLRVHVSRNAFGAIAVTLPQDPTLLALLLVRGMQQMKIGALFDLFDLVDPAGDEKRYSVPWRSSPQSLGGLLQAAYVLVGVVEFWKARRSELSGDAAGLAESYYNRSRTDTAEAFTQLHASDSLTDLGRQLVQTLGETAAPWLDEPLRVNRRPGT